MKDLDTYLQEESSNLTFSSVLKVARADGGGGSEVAITKAMDFARQDESGGSALSVKLTSPLPRRESPSPPQALALPSCMDGSHESKVTQTGVRPPGPVWLLHEKWTNG